MTKRNAISCCYCIVLLLLFLVVPFFSSAAYAWGDADYEQARRRHYDATTDFYKATNVYDKRRAKADIDNAQRDMDRYSFSRSSSTKSDSYQQPQSYDQYGNPKGDY